MAEERLSLSEAEATGPPASQPAQKPPPAPAPKPKLPQFFPAAPSFRQLSGLPKIGSQKPAPATTAGVPGAGALHRDYQDEVYDLISRARTVGVIGFEKQYEAEINALAEHYKGVVSPPPDGGFVGDGAGFIRASLASYISGMARLEAKSAGLRPKGRTQLGIQVFRFGTKPPEHPQGTLLPQEDWAGGYYVEPGKLELRRRITGEYEGGFGTALKAGFAGARSVLGGGPGQEPWHIRRLGGTRGAGFGEQLAEEAGTVAATAGKLTAEALLTRGLVRGFRTMQAGKALAEGELKTARAMRPLSPAEMAEAPFRRKIGEFLVDATTGVFGVYGAERWIAPMDTRILASLKERGEIERWDDKTKAAALSEARKQVALGAAKAYAALSVMSPAMGKLAEYATRHGKFGAYAVRVGLEPAAMSAGFMAFDPEVWDSIAAGDWRSVTAKFVGAGIPFAVLGVKAAVRNVKYEAARAKERDRLLNPQTPEDHQAVSEALEVSSSTGRVFQKVVEDRAEASASAKVEAEEGASDAEVVRLIDEFSSKQIRETTKAVESIPGVERGAAGAPVFDLVYWTRALEGAVKTGSSSEAVSAVKGFFESLGKLAPLAEKAGVAIEGAIGEARKVFFPLEQGSLARPDVQQASRSLAKLADVVGGFSGKVGEVIKGLRETLERPGPRLGEKELRPTIGRGAEEEARFRDAVDELVARADTWIGQPEEVRAALPEHLAERFKLSPEAVRQAMEVASDRVAAERGPGEEAPPVEPAKAAPPAPAEPVAPPPAPTLGERIRQALKTAADPSFEAAMREPMTDAELRALVRKGGSRSMRGLSIRTGGEKTGPIVRWREGDVWAEARGPEALRKIREAFGTPKKAEENVGTPAQVPTSAAEPPVPEGMVRLYRGGDPRVLSREESVRFMAEHGAGEEWARAQAEAFGRWYTNREEAEFYRKEDPQGRLSYIDVPAKVAEETRVQNLQEGHPARRFSRRPEVEHFVPPEFAAQAKPLRAEPGVPGAKPEEGAAPGTLFAEARGAAPPTGAEVASARGLMEAQGKRKLSEIAEWMLDERSHGDEAMAEAAVKVWEKMFPGVKFADPEISARAHEEVVLDYVIRVERASKAIEAGTPVLGTEGAAPEPGAAPGEMFAAARAAGVEGHAAPPIMVSQAGRPGPAPTTEGPISMVQRVAEALASKWGVEDMEGVLSFLSAPDPRARAAALKRLFPGMVPKEGDERGMAAWVAFVEQARQESQDALREASTPLFPGKEEKALSAEEIARRIAQRTPGARRLILDRVVPRLAEAFGIPHESARAILKSGMTGPAFEKNLASIFKATAEGTPRDWKVFLSEAKAKVRDLFADELSKAQAGRERIGKALGRMYRSLVEARAAVEESGAVEEMPRVGRLETLAATARGVFDLVRGTQGLMSPAEAIFTIRALQKTGASAIEAARVVGNPIVQRHLADAIRAGQRAETVVSHFAQIFGEGIGRGKPTDTSSPTPGEIEAGKPTPEGREIMGKAADLGRNAQAGFIASPSVPFAPFVRFFEEMAGVVYDAYRQGPGDLMRSLDLAARPPKHAGMASAWGDPMVYFGPTVMDAWIKPYYHAHLRFGRLYRLITGKSRWDVTALRVVPSGKGNTSIARITPNENFVAHKVAQPKEHDRAWIESVGELNRTTGKPVTEADLREALPGVDLTKKIGETLEAVPPQVRESVEYAKLLLDSVRRREGRAQLESEVEMASKQLERARLLVERIGSKKGLPKLEEALRRREAEYEKAESALRLSRKPTDNMRQRLAAAGEKLGRARAQYDAVLERQREAKSDVPRLQERLRYLREDAWKEWGLDNYFPEMSHEAWGLTRDLEGLLSSEELVLGPQPNPRISVSVGDPFMVPREERAFWDRFATELVELPEVGYGLREAILQRMWKAEMHVGSLEANKKIVESFYGKLRPIGRWEHVEQARDLLAPAFDLELGQRLLFERWDKSLVEDPAHPGKRIKKREAAIFRPVTGGESVRVPMNELRRRIWVYRGGLLEKGYSADFLAKQSEAIRRSFGAGLSKEDRALLDNRIGKAFYNAYSVFGYALRWARLQGVSLAGGVNQMFYGMKDAASAGVPILYSLKAMKDLVAFQQGTLDTPTTKRLVRVLLESGIGVESMSRMHVGEAPLVQKIIGSKAAQLAWSPFRTGEMMQRATAAWGAYLAEHANLARGKGLLQQEARYQKELSAAPPEQRPSIEAGRKAEVQTIRDRATTAARQASVYGQLSMAAGAMPLVTRHPIFRQLFFLNNPTYRHNAQRWYHLSRYLGNVAFSAYGRLSSATKREHRYVEREDGSTVMYVRPKGHPVGGPEEVEATPNVRAAREALMRRAEWAESSRPHLLQPLVRAWMTSLVLDHVLRAAGLDWGPQMSMQWSKLPGASALMPTTDDPYAREKWLQLFGYGAEHFDPTQVLPFEVLGRVGGALMRSVRDGNWQHFQAEWPKVRHKLYPRGLDPLMTLTAEDADSEGNYPIYRDGEIYGYQNRDDLMRRFFIGGAGGSRDVFPLGFRPDFLVDETGESIGESERYLRAKEAWIAQDRARGESSVAWDAFRKALANNKPEEAIEIYETVLRDKLAKGAKKAQVAEQMVRAALPVSTQQLFDIADNYVLFTQAPMLIGALRTKQEVRQAQSILTKRAQAIHRIDDAVARKKTADAARKAFRALFKRKAQLEKK